jgi:hypothetical protein
MGSWVHFSVLVGLTRKANRLEVLSSEKEAPLNTLGTECRDRTCLGSLFGRASLVNILLTQSLKDFQADFELVFVEGIFFH